MLGFLSWLMSSVWRYGSAVIDLEDDWVAIVSTTELQLADAGRSRVEDELARLRQRSLAGSRAVLLGRIQEIFSRYDRPAQTMLPADLRRKIYKDVLIKLSPDWLDQIRQLYPELTSLESNWTPSTYEKNLLGQMIDMAETTGPDHLSIPGFVQMIKGVHLCLIQSLGSAVTPGDAELLLEMVAQAIVPILDLWLLTLRNAQDGLARQGRLPSKWLQEQKVHAEIVGRYSDGDQDQVRQRYLGQQEVPTGLLVDRETMAQRREMLLQQMAPKPRRLEPHVPIDFQKRLAQLERKLSTVKR